MSIRWGRAAALVIVLATASAALWIWFVWTRPEVQSSLEEAAPAVLSDEILGDWLGPGGDAGLSGRCPGGVAASYGVRWRRRFLNSIPGSPVIRDEIIYVGLDDGAVVALSLASGDELWTAPVGGAVYAAPLLVGDTLYTGTLTGSLHALDTATGRLRWTLNTGGEIHGSPNFFAGRADKFVLVGNYDNRLLAVTAATGEVAWEHRTGHHINGTPAIAGEEVVVGSCDHRVHILDATNGREERRVDAEGYVAGSVVAVNDWVFAATWGGEVLKIDTNTGDIAWRFMIDGEGFQAPLAVAPRTVVGGTLDGVVIALDSETGIERWRRRTKGPITAGCIVGPERVLVPSEDGQLYILDLDSGAIIWREDFGAALLSTPAPAGSRLAVSTEDGSVYLLDAMERYMEAP